MPSLPIAQAYLPALLALCSAFLFALSDHLSNRGLETVDARAGAVVSVLASAVCFWCFAPWLVEAQWWLTGAALLFGLVGIFRPSLSITLALMGIKRLGPTLASSFAATSPLFGAVLAIAFLGEHLSLETAAGTLLVVAGAIVAAGKSRGIARNWPLWAILLPLGAAFIRGSGHVVTKLGYGELAQPFFASLVGNTVSAIVVLAGHLLQGRTLSGGLRAHKWFIVGGLLNGLSIYSLNSALELGTVVTVMPITAATPVFTMLLGLLVFRRETITWRTVLTIALVVPGVLLVIMRG
jgi:drug/metabolite transporter (DMT)-like permease